MVKPGIFITFEGGEGAGKSTLIEGLTHKLALLGLSVLKTREPGGTKLGEHIRAMLLQHFKDMPINDRAELFLFLASRAEHVKEVILPALEDGKVVFCDRFTDSTLAYQGAARDLGIDPLVPLCKFAAFDLEPSVTLYLDIDPKIGLKRAQNKDIHDRIESEALSFHQKIRDAYHTLAKKFPARLTIIDASKPPKVVLDESFEIIQDLLKAHELI